MMMIANEQNKWFVKYSNDFEQKRLCISSCAQLFLDTFFNSENSWLIFFWCMEDNDSATVISYLNKASFAVRSITDVFCYNETLLHQWQSIAERKNTQTHTVFSSLQTARHWLTFIVLWGPAPALLFWRLTVTLGIITTCLTLTLNLDITLTHFVCRSLFLAYFHTGTPQYAMSPQHR